MIRTKDAVLLAYTKLRARKIRLIVTVVISSLLFGVLAFSSFVVRGVVHSTNSFAQEGFGKRFLLSADPSMVQGGQDIYSNKSVIARAKALQKKQIKQKEAEAKRVGIDYDKLSERPVATESDGPDGKETYLDVSHPLVMIALAEHYAKNPGPGIPELQKLTKDSGNVSIYENRYIDSAAPNVGVLKVLKENKESFDQKPADSFNPFTTGIDSFTSSWSLMSGDLLKTFTLDGTTGVDSVKKGQVPIISPYTATEQLLGLTPLPASATPKTRLERLKEVRERAGSIEFGVCYRNSASQELVNQAITTAADIEQNKNNKDYVKPDLIYGLPKKPCSPVVVERDVRSAFQKDLDTKNLKFRQKFGEEKPTQQILQFKVVGIAPDPPDYTAAFVDGLISSILSSNIGASWYTPVELREDNKILQKFFPANPSSGRQNNFIVEMPSADAAKNLIKTANCDPYSNSSGEISVNVGVPDGNFEDFYKQCDKQGKVFYFMPYGSSSLAIDELSKGFGKFFSVASMVIAGIAAVIMMGTLGRIIADARRETAVFRAIGAKRLDIAQIYIIYALAVSLMIAITAILIGFILAQIVDSKWGSQFTVKALVLYNAQDLTRQFNLYAWHGRDLLYITLASLAAGLVGSSLPLLRNLRRNPIQDMRDEN